MYVLVRVLRWALYALLTLLAGIALYFGVSSALLYWPVPATQPSSDATIDIYVQSNGVHTDLVLPVVTAQQDWRRFFPTQHMRQVEAAPAWLALGWGNREFYLNTPQWSDLTLRTAWGALSGQGGTLLHAEYLRVTPRGPQARRWRLTPAQYAVLIAYVHDTVRQEGGHAMQIAGYHYNRRDAFYEAHGRYHLFRTCNGWTGAALRRVAAPVSAWTPFDWQVLWHLPRV
ncbi:TIGR02117 family protein [Chitinolyticbacter albus]|uniref:TIGR02117 family protein n=1 Tax=Chitinolyticbacter albus TaxID=2961951 RepID=UPI00210A2788|nr:TIGR02117 family protein [Chitinolyticbacter albus]